VEQGQKVPPLSVEDLIHLYRIMLLNRRIDERMIKLHRQGRIGFYIGSMGEEAAIIGSAFALEKKDWLFSCYRELGAILLRGFSLFELFCQLFGNDQDVTRGRQMPNHYASRELRFASISSPVGSQIPHAVGASLAARIRKSGEIALTYFGDGATSEGDFHVALNFAGVYKTPTLFFCRNNQWAISVPFNHQTASENIAVKAKAYGIEGVRVDGNDVFGVYSVTRRAADRARSGKGPTLIEAVTYRQGAHSTSDDPRAYREETEVKAWQEKDPLRRLKAYLVTEGHWDEAKDSGLEEEIRRRIRENLKKAETIGPPPIESMFEDLLDEIPWHLKEQLEQAREVTDRQPVKERAAAQQEVLVRD
jgi:2-oxoisovalerate dehydrogenase E1 component alpha subunit